MPITRVEVFEAARRRQLPINVPLDPWRRALRRELGTQRFARWFTLAMSGVLPAVLAVGIVVTSASLSRALGDLVPLVLFWSIAAVVVRLTGRRRRGMRALLAVLDDAPVQRPREEGRLTDQERHLIRSLPEPIAADDFLFWFGAPDGRDLGLELLGEVVRSRVDDDLWAALRVCFVFGLDGDHVPLLAELWDGDWHEEHLDVVAALGATGAASAVPVLLGVVDDVPRHLEGLDAWRVPVAVVDALGTLDVEGDGDLDGDLDGGADVGDARELALAELTGHVDRVVAGYAWVRLVDLHPDWWQQMVDEGSEADRATAS
jgi:hypothetical protein